MISIKIKYAIKSLQNVSFLLHTHKSQPPMLLRCLLRTHVIFLCTFNLRGFGRIVELVCKMSPNYPSHVLIFMQLLTRPLHIASEDFAKRGRAKQALKLQAYVHWECLFWFYNSCWLVCCDKAVAPTRSAYFSVLSFQIRPQPLKFTSSSVKSAAFYFYRAKHFLTASRTEVKYFQGHLEA